jgi:hypothetical protein
VNKFSEKRIGVHINSIEQSMSTVKRENWMGRLYLL